MAEHIALSEVEATLHELIQRLRDEQEAFRELGQRLMNEEAKRHFLEATQRRAEYAAELENEMHRMGVHDTNVKPSTGTKMKDWWAEMSAGIQRGDSPLLTSAEAREDETKKIYAEALRHDLPKPLREMLETQYAHIQRSHDEVKAMRDKRY